MKGSSIFFNFSAHAARFILAKQSLVHCNKTEVIKHFQCSTHEYELFTAYLFASYKLLPEQMPLLSVLGKLSLNVFVFIIFRLISSCWLSLK